MKLKLIAFVIIALTLSQSLYCMDANQKLMSAIENNDLALAKEAIDEGADPNYDLTSIGDRAMGLSDPGAPLRKAIQNLDMIRFLIQSKANINLKGMNYTPLIAAIGIPNPQQRKEIVDLLIELGADVNLSSWHTTPLMEAVNYGKIDIVATLLEHGANPYGKRPRPDIRELPNTAMQAARKRYQEERDPDQKRIYKNIMDLLEASMKKPIPKKPVITKEPELKEDEETL